MLASLLVALVRPRLAVDRVLFPGAAPASSDQTDPQLIKD